MGLGDQLLITVVDKLLIAAVIAALALYFNRKLEAFKAELSTRLETFKSILSADQDLLTRRFDAYGDLWAKTGPIAIYTDEPFEPEQLKKLREDLSVWYFSAKGGMFLTETTRGFYFCLQDLLKRAGELSGWSCQVRPSNSKARFCEMLEERRKVSDGIRRVLDALNDERPEAIDTEDWRACCDAVSDELTRMVRQNAKGTGEAIFSSIQQVASVLRSNLARELRSRLDVRRRAVGDM